ANGQNKKFQLQSALQIGRFSENFSTAARGFFLFIFRSVVPIPRLRSPSCSRLTGGQENSKTDKGGRIRRVVRVALRRPAELRVAEPTAAAEHADKAGNRPLRVDYTSCR